MATTLTNLPVKRWTVTGISRPQPLAGTVDRAREAYEAMRAADWAETDGGPAIPAHDYDADAPAPGDAYRQTWGYDAAARTERSATGAVCYSVKVPSDALTGEACSVVSVAAALVGDRWLDGGAIVSAIVSASAAPPPFSDFLAAPATTEAMLAPTPADKPEGAPANWRNLRADATGTLALDVDAASDAWLHICLRVADYLFVYGSWHDGGVMLNPESISVSFSRDVAADDTSVIARWTPPEEELGGEAALSRAAVVFGSVSWPTGICAGLPAPVLWDAVDDAMRLPFVAAENVFNGHHSARLGRWPDASGTLPQGDWAAVGVVEERWSGQSFPWLCGFILGLRVHLRGRSRTFSRLDFGPVPATSGLVVRVAAYLAGDPPADASGLRLSTPDAARLDWGRLFIGSATSLPLCGGGEMALSPVVTARIDLAEGATGIPAALRVEDSATIVLAVAPLAPETYAHVNWPLCDWILS